MSDLLFDTCFLIDLERELYRGDGRAHAFLGKWRSARAWENKKIKTTNANPSITNAPNTDEEELFRFRRAMI